MAIVEITISLGVPASGTPSVYQIKVKKPDSAGFVVCAMSGNDKKIVLQALLSFMGALLE